MADLRTMDTVSVLRWYASIDTMWLDVDGVETLIGHGITDTDNLAEAASLAVVEDLDEVPDMPVTMDNLRLLAKVGARVMVADPDAAPLWAEVVDMSDHVDSESLGLFLDAGRGPAYARGVMLLLDRVPNAPDLDNLDLTLPLADLTDLIEADISTGERDQWAGHGIDATEAIAYRHDGVSIELVERCRAEGVPPERWKDYVTIPAGWLSSGGPGWRAQPAGWATLDVLLELVNAGVEDDEPWAGRVSGGGDVYLTAEQVLRAAQVGMTSDDAGRYYAASTVKGGHSVENSPPYLIAAAWRGGWRNDQTPVADDMFTAWLDLFVAGVKPSHLNDYRWGGCHNYAEILNARAAGITPALMKVMRAKYGTARNKWSSRRIRDYRMLMTAWADHTEETA